MRGLGTAALFAALVSALPIPRHASQRPLQDATSIAALPDASALPEVKTPEVKTPDGLLLRVQVHSDRCVPVTVTLDASTPATVWTFACPKRAAFFLSSPPLLALNAAALLCLVVYGVARAVHSALAFRRRRGSALAPGPLPRRFFLRDDAPVDGWAGFDERKYCFDHTREKVLVAERVSMEQEISDFRDAVDGLLAAEATEKASC